MNWASPVRNCRKNTRAPGRPTAARAYALLDEYLTAGYSGSSGTHVPPDVQSKLDNLRQIAESTT